MFNTNLAYVNRLFTEHSTTKNEKMGILKRFDSAESIKESKTIYKSIKGELENKKPITESVEDKVNKTELSKIVATKLAKKAQEKKITKIYFDRGIYRYHGRVKVFAETLRENGMEF